MQAVIGRRGGAGPGHLGRTVGGLDGVSLLLGLTLLTLGIVGCGPSAADVLEKRAAGPTASPAPVAPAAPQAAPATGGDEKVTGPVAVRLNGVQFSDKGNYVSPKEGMIFMALDVSFRNVGQQEVTVGSRAISLKDASGTEYRRNLTAASKPSPDSTLPPGKETRGELTYEVPKDATAFQLAVTVGEGAQPATFEINRT